MAINLVLRRPVPTPALQLRVVWQGFRNGDIAEARWADAAGRLNRWSGSAGLLWLQRDALQAEEQWRIDLGRVPGDVQLITLSMSSPLARTVGVLVQQLTGDPNVSVVHPGADLAAGSAVELIEFRRVGGGWQVAALNSPVNDASPQPQPGPPGSPFPGWPGPVHDGPAPVPGTGRPMPPWPDHVDDGPRVPIPDRIAQAVDAARSTGKVRRARVTAVVDLSASMYPWIASGAVADALTAVQALAGAAQRTSVSTRFLPDGAGVDLQLDTEPAAAMQTHLRTVGLRTGDRGRLLRSLAGETTTDTVTLMVTDDASLVDEPGIGSATAIVLGADTRGPTGAPDSTGGAVFLPPGPVDVNRLARDLADRCFTTARR